MLDLLYSRRSIRKYTSQSIEPEKIEKIIEAALLSPTSRNREAWEFVVVTDKVSLNALSVSKPGTAIMLSEAPLAIVVCGNPLDSDAWIEDCSIAAIIIQLAAHDLGLGSCWIQMRGRSFDGQVSSSEYIKKRWSYLIILKSNVSSRSDTQLKSREKETKVCFHIIRFSEKHNHLFHQYYKK